MRVRLQKYWKILLLIAGLCERVMEKSHGLYIIDGKLGSYSDAEYRQIKKQLLGGSKKTEAETLRDKFAMAAVQGILDGSARSHRDYEDIAIDSYVLADLMLKARKKRV